MAARIIVFRFDRNPLICRSRVAYLRANNPGVPIVGLYGGRAGYRQHAFRSASHLVLGLDALYVAPQPGIWNWKHGDLALAAWFRDVGNQWEFDVAHFVEWDLLLAAPLATIYGDVPVDALGLTCLTPVDDVGEAWPWLNSDENRAEYEQLVTIVSEGGRLPIERLASLGVGPCFPRAFLSDYAALDLEPLAHDELRVPLYAQALGYPLVDNGLRRSWVSSSEDEIFNASGRSVAPSTILRELSRAHGRRAFHPVRQTVRAVERRH